MPKRPSMQNRRKGGSADALLDNFVEQQGVKTTKWSECES